jgi:hypothetical protein
MSSQMAQLQEATIKAQCKALRMPMIASQFGTLAEQAIREKKSHIGYLEALLLAEIEEREDARLSRGWIYRARRTGAVHRRVWHRQDTLAHRTLRRGMPAETACALHDGGRAGE